MRGGLLRTIGDTILMYVKPWFSLKVGKDFRKREKGGEKDYHDMGKDVIKKTVKEKKLIR